MQWNYENSNWENLDYVSWHFVNYGIFDKKRESGWFWPLPNLFEWFLGLTRKILRKLLNVTKSREPIRLGLVT